MIDSDENKFNCFTRDDELVSILVTSVSFVLSAFPNQCLPGVLVAQVDLCLLALMSAIRINFLSEDSSVGINPV